MNIDVDALPDLSDGYAVPSEAVETFRRDGHALLRGVASPDEVEAYGPAIHEAALTHRRDTRPLAERETYGKAFIQVINLWKLDPRVARFVLARRFAQVAADLMGVDGVRLYHDQALFKEAGGGYTPFHQDQPYWPLDTDHTITMWMPLVDVTPEMGTMSFVSGSYLRGDLGTFGISDQTEEIFSRWVDEQGLSIHNHGAMSAGDATFHAGWTLHRADPNQTDRMRAVMTVIYVADGTRVAQPTEHNTGDLRFLGGRESGELIDADMNPLLFRR